MRRRVAALIPPALLCLLTLLLLPANALAHRLLVKCQVLPEQKVQVDAWYDAPGRRDPASAATVQVFRVADGQLLTEGRLDADGKFIFGYEKAERLRVVVTQTGHRGEVTMAAERLATRGSDTAAEEDRTVVISETAPAAYDWIKDVVIGVAFLLALAAFFLSVGNARRLRDMERDADAKR